MCLREGTLKINTKTENKLNENGGGGVWGGGEIITQNL